MSRELLSIALCSHKGTVSKVVVEKVVKYIRIMFKNGEDILLDT